ncbi:MAG: lipopolysaccharide biosynthesis protein [Desulfovibrionaceae bacterium]|nr:lipopolysaccharide biosynthesis protein [Desulfovibrionaceae bacterium]
MQEAPLASRYFFKLLANIASVPVYLIMEALLPRALGPVMYGNYNFATTVFTQLLGFLDMGTSTCFYNALSRRQDEVSLIRFYLGVSLILFCVAIGVGLIMLWPAAGTLFLPDVPPWLAPLAALFAFLTWIGRVLRSTNDAIGATIHSEIIRTVVSLTCVLLLVLLFLSDTLTIYSLFLQQYLMLSATAIGFWLVTRANYRERGIVLTKKLERGEVTAYAGEFWSYSHPLFVQALLSFLMLTAERWLLQLCNGSAEQGFFALSQKVSMACFLFVSAMTPLIMRELSIAWGQKDTETMGRLLTRFSPILFFIAAYFSCFTVAEAETLVDLFGGAQFTAAILPVQIMALYPLHQALGQLAGSVFHATGRTHVLRNMAIAECFYGSFATWLLVAPPSFMGLGLGATGLAVKTVCVQFITVNGYLWLATRFIPFSFWKNLGHQFLATAVLLVTAGLAREMTVFFPLGESFSLLRFLASGLLYTFVTMLLVLAFPQIMGCKRGELKEKVQRFFKARLG